MIAFDAHLDLAWNAIDWNRDLTRPVSEIRSAERALTARARGTNTVSFPALREGRVAICIATLLAKMVREATPPVTNYRTREAAYAASHGQLAYYRAMEQRGWVRRINDLASLEEHTSAWLNGPGDDLPLGIILSMEGAEPILSPEQLPEWWEAGLRLVGLSHYGNGHYAHGTGTDGGLLPEGRSLLAAMEQAGMILDVTHLTDAGFDEAMDAFGGPVLASHHNCRALVPRQRQLTDDQIGRLIERGAVIGAAFDAWMLQPDWVAGQDGPARVTLQAVVDHIDHVCQLAGNARHAALGTDLDGGFGREQCPTDLETIADLQSLPALLEKRGYPAADIEGIMYRNWLDFFRRAWGAT